MSDIVERLLVMAEEAAIPCGEPFEDLVVGYCTQAADEITRLRSLLKEAGDSIQRLYHYHRGCHEDEDVMEPSASDWAVAWEQSRIVLCKIKGEA